MRPQKKLKARKLIETPEYVLVEDLLLGQTPLYVIYWKYKSPNGSNFFPRGHSTSLDFESKFGIPARWKKYTGLDLPNDVVDVIDS